MGTEGSQEPVDQAATPQGMTGDGFGQDQVQGTPSLAGQDMDELGLPVPRRAAGRVYLLTAVGCLICAIVAASLATAAGINRDLPGSLRNLGVVMGFLPAGVLGFGGPLTEKIWKLGPWSRAIVVAAGILGTVSAAYIVINVEHGSLS